MPNRRSIKSVLHGFLGTFTSRYSDYDGYWAFGLITNAMNRLTINLLEDEGISPGKDVRAFVTQLARRKFRKQMDKEKLPMSFVNQAQMSVTQSAEPAKGFVAGHRCPGRIYIFSVEVITDLGRPIQAKAQVFVAPHNPSLEHRSVRRK